MGNINIDHITQLKFDIVLLEKASPAIARLNSLEIRIFSLDVKSMGDEE
jgi:iron complex transport system substrate-binding protein